MGINNVSMSKIDDELNRVVKLVMDSGEAQTLAEAQQIVNGYKLAICVGADIAGSATRQAALLTAVNTARRCFLGGVQVAGDLDMPLLVPWRTSKTVREAIVDLQGTSVPKADAEIPSIVIGEVPDSGTNGEFSVRATFNGWSGGVVPTDGGERLEEQIEFVPAGILAGALAVGEAFQFVRGDHGLAGRRDIGLSLWRPERDINWLDADAGPRLNYLPSRLWLIGLGHLGQSYLWTLGLLPYAAPQEVQLVLQDFDSIVIANDSTSPLTEQSLIGMHKTRAMARWCEGRGFRTVIHERRFATNFQLDENEPALALSGVDNISARVDLDRVGFRYVVDAGLGRGPHEYLTFQVHTLPASRSAHTIWNRPPDTTIEAQSLVGTVAYQALANERSLDECGLVTLAQRTVGAPFVGIVASTLAIAEVLRLLSDGPRYEIVDGDLRTLDSRQAIPHRSAPAPFNPGITQAI